MYIRETKVKPNLKTDAVKKTNKTVLPDRLKYGIENISGYSMDDVRVHYNSAQPAQMKSLAYTQGSEIYVAPGQERHLSHEAWHVVQQKQGRVAPTEQMNGININSSRSLEQEADSMGAKAMQVQLSNPVIKLKNAGAVPCVQKKKGDLCCQATIEYGGVNKGSVSAPGSNDTGDKEMVIKTFGKYGLSNLEGVKQVENSNPPGQCAEPHAVAQALESGNGQIIRPIDKIKIGPAQYTDDFKARISKQIECGRMSPEDLTMVSTLIKNNNIDITAEDNKEGEIEDIVRKIIADNIQAPKKGLISQINKSNLIRFRCSTCQQWISESGSVPDSYRQIPAIGYVESLVGRIDEADKSLEESQEDRQLQKCINNLQGYYKELSGLAGIYGLPVEGTQEAMDKAKEVEKKGENKLALKKNNKKSKQQKFEEKLQKLSVLLAENSHH